MKRLFALMLAAAMLLAMAACGAAEASAPAAEEATASAASAAEAPASAAEESAAIPGLEDGVFTMISNAATRPGLSMRGISSCEMTATRPMMRRDMMTSAAFKRESSGGFSASLTTVTVSRWRKESTRTRSRHRSRYWVRHFVVVRSMVSPRRDSLTATLSWMTTLSIRVTVSR